MTHTAPHLQRNLIPPGSALGVLGGGQLGRMFAMAARSMGYRIHVMAPDDDPPTAHVADEHIQAPFEDLDAVARFAHRVDVVTFEFENVHAQATEVAAKFAPVRPAGQVLHTTQHRLREKSFLRDAGLPVTPFAPVHSPEELREAIGKLGAPAVLKTAAWGYDGKGQTVVRSPKDAEDAWAELGTDEAILEAFIDFEMEVSVVGVRGLDGTFAAYGPIANDHSRHILDISVLPAPVTDQVRRDAVEITRAVLEALDVVGVLCVEFFALPTGKLLINECAPRPHNSGHLTIDGCVTSQFEQQVRAICGLPLGSTELLRPTAMANLLGDLWQAGELDWRALRDFPEVKLHLYGKGDARPGRKMGHLTVCAATPEAAKQRVRAARAALARQ